MLFRSTNAESRELDPVRFRLEVASDSSDVRWRTVGSSSSYISWAGTRYFSDSWYNTPQERLDTVFFDLRVPWLTFIHRVGCRGLLISAHLGIAFAAFMNEPLHGRYVIVFCLSLISLLHSTLFLRCLFPESGSCTEFELFVPIALFVITSLNAYFLAIAETFTFHVLCLGGMGHTITFLVYYFCILRFPGGLIGDDGLNIILNDSLLEGLAALLISVSACIFRTYSKARTLADVCNDEARFNECWEVMTAHDTVSGNVLGQISTFVEEICKSLPPTGAVRQMKSVVSVKSDSRQSDIAHPSVVVNSDSASVETPITCLDELMSQALVLNLILKEKIIHWTKFSSGCLPVSRLRGDKAEIEYLPWTRIENDSESIVHWPGLKPVCRAIDKVYCCYNMDVSRLLDCCRHQILFEEPRDLLRGLQSICHDENVQIIRITNTFGQDYSSSRYHGYRQVLGLLLIVWCL